MNRTVHARSRFSLLNASGINAAPLNVSLVNNLVPLLRQPGKRLLPRNENIVRIDTTLASISLRKSAVPIGGNG